MCKLIRMSKVGHANQHRNGQIKSGVQEGHLICLGGMT